MEEASRSIHLGSMLQANADQLARIGADKLQHMLQTRDWSALTRLHEQQQDHAQPAPSSEEEIIALAEEIDLWLAAEDR